jgi:CheY-like chemotaxis protein/Tfp pilus assembly protein PilZ
MTIANEGRIILRAEIRSSSDFVIAYGVDLTSTSIFVVTEWLAAIGTPVSLRLSFPKILEPIDVTARIADVRAAGEPGAPGGIQLTFDAYSGDVAARLASLLERAHTPSAPPGEDRPCRVLLVEDSWMIRDMFTYGTTKFFERPGGGIAFTVDHAEGTEQAWKKLEHSTYDLAIIDYFLPAEHGASLIAQMRRDERLAHTPIVAISVGGRDAREAMQAAGADVFLDKPVVFSDLLNTLRMLAEHRPSSAGA